MKKHENEMYLGLMKQVEKWDLAERLKEYLSHVLRTDYGSSRDEELENAFHKLTYHILRNKDRVLRNTFMWGALTDGKLRRKAQLLAVKEFFEDERGRYDNSISVLFVEDCIRASDSPELKKDLKNLVKVVKLRQKKDLLESKKKDKEKVVSSIEDKQKKISQLEIEAMTCIQEMRDLQAQVTAEMMISNDKTEREDAKGFKESSEESNRDLEEEIESAS